MNTLRALIVDDEEPARELLKTFLIDWPMVEIVGEAEDGAAGLTAVRRLAPDLVFLDIQMPVMSGFDLIAQLSPDEIPLIVFETAYDQHALRAFEVSAVDYLLKPFDAARFRSTMTRVLQYSQSRTNFQAAVRSLMAHVRGAQTSPLPTPIAVRVDDRHVFLAAGEIEWIEAAGKDVRLHLTGRTIVARESLSSLERRLTPGTFVRVHRSAVVNRFHIREMQSWFKGSYVIITRGGDRIVTGRRFRAAAESLLSG
jgi:two-component system LytT family response regulator